MTTARRVGGSLWVEPRSGNIRASSRLIGIYSPPALAPRYDRGVDTDRSFVRSFPPRARDPLCPGLIYVSTPRTLPTHVGTHQFAARYTSDTGDYRVITRRFDYGLPPRICRLSAGLEGLHPRLDETVASHRGAAPRLRTVYTFVRLRAEGTHLCVYVCVSSDLDIGWDRVACNRE